jgi:hypothetical protein
MVKETIQEWGEAKDFKAKAWALAYDGSQKNGRILKHLILP